MSELRRSFSCTTKDGPPGKVIYIMEDTDGWFWIKKYVEEEGFKTPFSSIDEIEVFLGLKFETKSEILT